MKYTQSNNKHGASQFFRKSLISAAVATSLLSSFNLSAQTAEEEEFLKTLEEVVVTGTRREGVKPTETLSPIDVIGGGVVSQQASFDLTDSLSKVAPSINTQRFPIADGTAFIRPVTLRNLSPDHTLVLVNGTRRHRSALVNLQLAPLGTSNQGSQAVDFSTIPSAAIKRIEVLRDGASAQYGSDAIAGVVNIILNDANEGFNLSTQYGSYFEGDGDRFTVSANGGFAVGDNGFVNATFENSTSDITTRGNARPDAAAVADIVGADLVPFDGFGQRWGDPDIESQKFFINAGFDINENLEIYGNASYMSNETRSGFFYRGPVLDPSAGIAARSTLQTDSDGDFLPDPAPQSLIDSIVGDGLDPADYLVADAGSASGYVLRNPIYTLFPGGYNPTFGANIDDMAFVFGARGEMSSGMSYDIRGRFAENEVSYLISDTINPSLGRLSPTTFNPGTLTQEETSLNADFVTDFEVEGFASAVNVGFGFEYRNETYIIAAGDVESTSTGPTFAQFGVGSDGFQGFAPESAGSFESDSWGTYIDFEADVSEELTLGSAFRFEDFDEFDSTFDWKLSARYAISDSLAIRATANTGFRAPTPGQVNTLNTTTTADSSGRLIPSGTFPVNNPVALALGSMELDPEESTSFTIGAVFEAEGGTSITLDYYDIEIKDRLALRNITVGADEMASLTAAGIPNVATLDGSNLNYFVNAFDSNVSGLDLAITHDFALSEGNVQVDFRHSYNKQEVNNINPNTINASRAADLENQVPNNRTVVTFDYDNGNSFGALLRISQYGEWDSSSGLFGPGDGSDTANYGAETLVDIEARWTIDDTYTITAGGDNIFDVTPDAEQDGTLRYLGAESAVTSPFGFNGGLWYIRATASF